MQRNCGQLRTFVCQREIQGSDAPQTLALSDFSSEQGSPKSWSEIDQLGLCASHGLPANEVPLCEGPAPEFVRLAWE